MKSLMHFGLLEMYDGYIDGYNMYDSTVHYKKYINIEYALPQEIALSDLGTNMSKNKNIYQL